MLWVDLLLYLFLILFFLWGSFSKRCETHWRIIRFYEQNLNECTKLYEKLRKQCTALLKNGCVIRDEHIIIGEDNLPKKHVKENPYKPFTVYVSPNGAKLHQRYGCSGAKIKRHIYAVKPAENLSSRLCAKCTDEDVQKIASFLELAVRSEANLRLAERKFEHLSSLHDRCSTIPGEVRRHTRMQRKIDVCNMRYERLKKTAAALHLDFQKVFIQNFFGIKCVECYNVIYSDYPPAERGGREYTSPAIVRPLSEDPASGYRLFRAGLSNGGCRTFLKDTDIIYPGKECALSDSEGRMCYILLPRHPKRLL